jgi:hypothetical protein
MFPYGPDLPPAVTGPAISHLALLLNTLEGKEERAPL